MGNVIAVASGKGGTGKTSFCANVAISLCALGEKVLVIDADSGLRSLDLVLGMTDRLLFSYGDVIRGAATLKEAAVPHPVAGNLRVLTAPGEPGIAESFLPEQIAALVARVRAHFTFTLIDCAAGLGRDVLSFAAAADRAVVVSTSDYTALRGAQSTAGVLERVGQENCAIVVNRLRPGMIRAGSAANIDRAMDSAGLSLLGAVPEDEAVIACGNSGAILALEHYGPAAQAYMNIAKRLRGQRVRLLDQVPGHWGEK
ncbi:MAG: P-loop NTPase [Clostridia bacterium]|nr:P-loop NTPase [Clostridia bacterium]